MVHPSTSRRCLGQFVDVGRMFRIVVCDLSPVENQLHLLGEEAGKFLINIQQRFGAFGRCLGYGRLLLRFLRRSFSIGLVGVRLLSLLVSRQLLRRGLIRSRISRVFLPNRVGRFLVGERLFR
jgi:hypothetical protein